jgi:hypothetical protein
MVSKNDTQPKGGMMEFTRKSYPHLDAVITAIADDEGIQLNRTQSLPSSTTRHGLFYYEVLCHRIMKHGFPKKLTDWRKLISEKNASELNTYIETAIALLWEEGN